MQAERKMRAGRQIRRAGKSGRLSNTIFLISMLALTSCAQRARVRRAVEETDSIELPACPSPVPPVPEEAATEGRYGVVLVGYTVETDGRVDEIDLEDPQASPLLFSAAKSWLERCRATSQGRTRPMRMSELFSFPPPEAPRVDEMPVALNEGSGISRPQRGSNCTPDKPPAVVTGGGTLTVEYVVHSNGRVGEVTLKDGHAARALFKTVRIWLQSCPYTPALRNGHPVPVTMVESFSFWRG
jgi:outer membrane biosynthesis protein TonB